MISLSLYSLLSRVCALPLSHDTCHLTTAAGWKRLLLADGPRQTINALTLYAVYLTHKDEGRWYDVTKYFAGNSASTTGLTLTTLFTTIVFAGSLVLLIVAGLCYIPLLCHIRGNLKVCSSLIVWHLPV